jgi:hypothetical protein
MEIQNNEFKGYTKSGKVRKRKPKKENIYFTEDTQESILLYNASKDFKEKEKIYHKKIHYPFFKLTENIIHTFKFYHLEVDSIEDLQHEVIEFLLRKIHLYNPDKGKAYSYFGTIAKRYLIAYTQKNYSKLINSADVIEVNNDYTKNVYLNIENPYITHDQKYEFMDEYIMYVEENLENLFIDKDQPIADAILELFRRRESIDVFNKKALYIYIREIVDAKTLHITKIAKTLGEIYSKAFIHYKEYGVIKFK